MGGHGGAQPGFGQGYGNLQLIGQGRHPAWEFALRPTVHALGPRVLRGLLFQFIEFGPAQAFFREFLDFFAVKVEQQRPGFDLPRSDGQHAQG